MHGGFFPGFGGFGGMHGISGMNGFGSGGGAGFGRKEPPVVRDISLTLVMLSQKHYSACSDTYLHTAIVYLFAGRTFYWCDQEV